MQLVLSDQLHQRIQSLSRHGEVAGNRIGQRDGGQNGQRQPAQQEQYAHDSLEHKIHLPCFSASIIAQDGDFVNPPPRHTKNDPVTGSLLALIT